MSEDKQGKLYKYPGSILSNIISGPEMVKVLDEAKAEFPFDLWQGNPDFITYFPKVKKGEDPDKVFSLGSGIVENIDAEQEIAKWFLKWFGKQKTDI